MGTIAQEEPRVSTTENDQNHGAETEIEKSPAPKEHENVSEYVQIRDELAVDDQSTSSQDEITIDDAIDGIGCGKFQMRVLVAVGLCFVADSMEITLLSFLSAVLKSEWELTASQSATITSSVFAGSLLGTLILGPMGDRRGRRPVFLLSALIISLFGFGTALAYSFPTLVAMRVIVGFGVGGLTIPFDIFAEFLPTDQRGKYLLLLEYFWTLGSLSVPILAYFTLGFGQSWNLFVFLCAFPCLLSAIVGYFYVPESPRWLASQGRLDEAMVILKEAAAINGKNPDDVFPSSVVLKEETEEEATFTDLFKPKWRKLTLLLWGVWFGFAFAYYGTILAVTRVFQDDNDPADDVQPSFNFKSIFISCSAEIVGTTLVIMTVDSFGRIRSQMLFYFLGGLCVFVFCLPQLADSVELLTFFAFCARIFEMGASCMTWVSTAEVLETDIRATGHSAANAVARIGGFLSPFLVEGDFPLLTVGTIMLIIHAFTVICVSMIPETKGKAMGVFHSARRDEHEYDQAIFEIASCSTEDRHTKPVL